MTQKRSAGSHYGGVKETGGTVHGTGEFTESSNDRLRVCGIGCSVCFDAEPAVCGDRVDLCGTRKIKKKSYGYRPWDSAGGKYEDLRRQL